MSVFGEKTGYVNRKFQGIVYIQSTLVGEMVLKVCEADGHRHPLNRRHWE